jgi:O-methyltransferase
VVECGTYAGGSTANLSLVCALVGRELEVFDSFEGLPDPEARDDVVLLGGGGGDWLPASE